MPNLSQPTLDNTAGAIVLGMAGAAFFVGISTLQVYLYYHHYPRDTLLYKYSVGILWLLDTFHLMLVIHAVYFYVVTNFGNPDNLDYIVWSVKLQMPINVVIVVMVQSLYAYRVSVLGIYHHSFLGYLSVPVVITGFAFGIILVCKIYRVGTYTDVLGVANWVLDGIYIILTIIDAVIAGSMCYYLRKSKISDHRLNSRISRLIQYTLGSGLLTSACSLASLLTWILSPDTLSYLALGFFLTKLYVGSFFAMLNARQYIAKSKGQETRHIRLNDHEESLPLSTTSGAVFLVRSAKEDLSTVTLTHDSPRHLELSASRNE